MGYTTEFQGKFEFNGAVDEATLTFLRKLNATRRMKRNVGPEYGVEGEMYVDGGGDYGQAHEPSITQYNMPPRTQPSLWCQWVPTADGTGLVWDGGEKFYGYVEWLQWIISKVLAPKGYAISGIVKWRGEDFDDVGQIVVLNNKISVERR